MAVQTLPFSTLIFINRQSAIPIFRQVANNLIKLIKNGKIKPGYQLPSSREMASMLQLNRTTIVASYEEMQVQGWLEVKKRKGNFVAKHLPVASPRSFQRIPEEKHILGDQKITYRQIAAPQPLTRHLKPGQLMMNDGYPDARIAPLEQIAERYKFLSDRINVHNKLLADGSKGSGLLRTELARFLNMTRALDVTPEQVLITPGAQMAIYVAASMILQPGSTVIVSELNYSLADKVFEQLGAKLIKVKMDQNGIDVEEIEKICKQAVPALLYIIPHHHHPTTVTLSAERRSRLLDIIRRYRLPVIEDDYDYDFHFDNAPVLPLASEALNSYVLYIGSISKTLSPTIRLGYLIGDDEFIWQASKLKQLLAIRGDVLLEESVGHLFKTGEMQRHLRRSVKLYKSRRDEFCEILLAAFKTIANFKVPAGGMAVWTILDPEYSIPQLSERLSAQGIYMNDGSIYQYKADVNGMRLGFASLNSTEMQSFAKALKKSR